MPISQVYEEVSKCSRCGYCHPTCPTYSVSGLEQEVARGRNTIVRGIIEGRLEFSKDLKKTLFQCLMCNACVTNCFPGVKTDRVIAVARNEYIKQFGQPQLQRYIFKDLLRKPDTLAGFVKLASFGKRSGISGLVNVLCILGWFGKNIANAEGLLDRIPKKFLRDSLNEMDINPRPRKGKVAYFVGCGINFAYPHVGESTVGIMSKLDYEIDVLTNYCCGLPAYAYGDLDAVKWFIETNLNILKNTDADVIVTDCGSCTSFLRKYPRLVEQNSELKETAELVSSKVQDVTTWLSERLDMFDFQSSAKAERITYHDPCHLAHHMNEREGPRRILQNLPNVEYIELPEADWCCGGAGSYNIAHYDISMKILDRKMKNVLQTDAQILATACPSCLIQLSYGARNQKLPLKVKHVTEVVLERMSNK